MNVRSLLGIALATLLIPAAASAAPRGSAPVASSGLSLGGFIGYESDDLGGPAFRFDGELPFQALSPGVNLSWVGSIGYSRLTKSVGAFGVAADITANVFKFIPAARFSFVLSPQFSLFADGGLGIYHAQETFESVFFDPFSGTYLRGSISDSTTSLMMRFAGGAWLQVNPQTRIGAAIEYSPYFGDFDQNTFTFQIGAMFRM